MTAPGADLGAGWQIPLPLAGSSSLRTRSTKGHGFAEETGKATVSVESCPDTGGCGWNRKDSRVIVRGMGKLLVRTTIGPGINHGKPVIRGLRYPVESMLESLAGGDTIEDLWREFPDLERDDLLACIEFAAQSLRLNSGHLALA